MDNSEIFDTFLFIGPKKLEILVKNKNDKSSYYRNEISMEHAEKEKNLLLIDKFLNQNIFKIEKEFNFFVKNIFLIIDDDQFLSVKVSFKRKNDKDIFNLKNLNYLLKEAKYQINESYKEKVIIHMIIDNYSIDNKIYKNLPNDVECNQFSISMNFICIAVKYIRQIEKILGNYQIKIQQIISVQYLRDIFGNNNDDFFDSGQKILDGYNPNEILLIPKSNKNKGFFEKFFHLFN